MLNLFTNYEGKMKFIIAALMLLTLNSVALARPATCKDAYQLSMAASMTHLNNPSINGELLYKAATVYLDFKDPYKIYLTTEESESLLSGFKKDQENSLAKLKVNDCSGFNSIDAKIKEGEARWKKYVKSSINDDKVLSAPEVVRDNADLKFFKSVSEIESYAAYFVSKYIKVEQAAHSKKSLVDIRKSFTKLYLTDKDKVQDEKEVQANLITRSLFLAMDPHSDYISEEQATNFEMSMTANLQGVGLALKEDELGAKVTKVVKNGPAEKSGLFKKDDIITKVNGKSISNMNVNDVVDKIRGDKGSKVSLSVSRVDKKTQKVKTFNCTLVRDVIPLEEQRVKAEEFNQMVNELWLLTYQAFIMTPHLVVVPLRTLLMLIRK